MERHGFEKGLLFLWLNLNKDPKVYVYAYPSGKMDLSKSISFGDTATVTIPKSNLANPRKAKVIEIKANGSSFGSIVEFIKKKSESKKYAWLMLIPAVASLVFLHGFREKNVEKAWELERSRNLDPDSERTGMRHGKRGPEKL